MLNTSNQLLLEKLIYLGKRFERTRIYELLEPWSFNGFDVIEVQKAGKKIGNFIGLPNLTFIINFTQQKQNSAGHIELNNNSDEGVFIELDEKYKSENETILAILAHEICHKLIHINGLSQFGYENEILADVATVYTGLGKLSLNGCEKKEVYTNIHRNNNEHVATRTNTQKLGYLNREQFAFLYNVVFNMRKIPKEYATKGLTYDALKAIDRNQYYHNEELFHNDFAIKKVKDTLAPLNHQKHLVLAESSKLIKTLQSNLEVVSVKHRAVHNNIKNTNDKYLVKASENLIPERLNYIKNLILVNDLNKLDGLFDDEMRDSTTLNNNLKNILQGFNEKFPINLKDREILYNIKCPICENKMQLRQDKLVKIKCTKCKYSFIIDNSLIDTLIYVRKNEKREKGKKSFKSKLKRIIEILKE